MKLFRQQFNQLDNARWEQRPHEEAKEGHGKHREPKYSNDNKQHHKCRSEEKIYDDSSPYAEFVSHKP
nr:uncharacterized protein CTRU02_15712 [Colletotrichum truncatum]KAF6780752.1 hypothetical protein CTRU02_15712 [Colletotrichum truncatum]